MFGRLAVVMVAMAASLVGGVSTAHAAPYNPRGDVDCTISVAAHTAGHHVVFRVGAVANSNPQPRGTLTITLTGGTSWSRTVHYPGHAITVVGPVVSAGSYRVTTHFTPANTSAFRGCRGALPFQVGVGPIHNHHGPGDNNGPLGVLPDTGGPDVMWLLVGTALLGAGATSVVASRRRRAVAVG